MVPAAQGEGLAYAPDAAGDSVRSLGDGRGVWAGALLPGQRGEHGAVQLIVHADQQEDVFVGRPGVDVGACGGGVVLGPLPGHASGDLR